MPAMQVGVLMTDDEKAMMGMMGMMATTGDGEVDVDVWPGHRPCQMQSHQGSASRSSPSRGPCAAAAAIPVAAAKA